MRFPRARITAVLLWGGLSVSAYAQPLELDVDMAVEMALQRNLGIRTQELSTMVDERNYADRWNVFLPRITGSVTLARPNEEPTDPLSDLYASVEQIGFPAPETEDPARWNLRTNIDISLTFTRAMIYGLQSRSEALEASRVELREARRETERDVRLAFFELLLQQEQIGLTERRIAEAQQRYAETQEDYDAGVVDEFTLLSAQVALENQRPALRRQRQGYSAALRQFALTIGAPADEQLVLEGDIGLDTVALREDEQIIPLVGRSAEVQRARRAIEQLQTARELTRSELYPTFTLGFSVDPSLSGNPFSDDILDGERWGQQSGSFTMTLRVPVDPLLPRSSHRTQMYEREMEIEQARLRAQQARDGVESRLLSLIESLQIAVDSLDSVGLNVELAERAYELAVEGYEAGLRDISAVRDAEIDLLDAQLDYLSEQFSYREALIELEFLLDTPYEKLRENEQ